MRVKPFIIYHADCTDGFGAAFAAYQVYSDSVKYYKGVYSKEPPNVENKDVYLLDISYPKDTMIRMAEQANSLTIIDHHATAQRSVQELLDDGIIKGTFNMEKSGAVLAWEFFNPDKRVPKLLKHIQDQDLWKFKMEGTREIILALNSYPFDFEVWESLGVAKLRSEGKVLARYNQAWAERVARNYCDIQLEGFSIRAVNAPHHMASDVANLLATGRSFAASWYFDGSSIVFSLRSDKNGTDVSKIAEKYGGGGHKHAAGFTLPGLDNALSSANIKEIFKIKLNPKTSTVQPTKTSPPPPSPKQPENIPREKPKPLSPGEPIPSQRSLTRRESPVRVKNVTVKGTGKQS